MSESLAWLYGTGLHSHQVPEYCVLKFQDFANPDPYSHVMVSRISNPASSMPQHSRCQVRVPPNASSQPPGFSTRYASAAHAWENSAN